MPKPAPSPDAEAYTTMLSIYTDHVSADDMGLNMETAVEPAEAALRQLSYTGHDDRRTTVIAAIALCDAVADNLSVDFVLPSPEEYAPYTPQDGTPHDKRPTRYLFVSDAEGDML